MVRGRVACEEVKLLPSHRPAMVQHDTFHPTPRLQGQRERVGEISLGNHCKTRIGRGNQGEIAVLRRHLKMAVAGGFITAVVLVLVAERRAVQLQVIPLAGRNNLLLRRQVCRPPF